MLSNPMFLSYQHTAVDSEYQTLEFLRVLESHILVNAQTLSMSRKDGYLPPKLKI